MKKKKKKKINKMIPILIAGCGILILIEMIYVSYHYFYREEKYLYFEGVNAVSKNQKNYVTVGSNNDNDFHFEKAKISVYNLKKEKQLDKVYNVGYNSSFFGVLFDGEDIVAVGSYERTLKEHEKSIRRALIVKYDHDGRIVFEKDEHLLDNSKFTKIIKVDDYYYVIGQSVYQNTKVGNAEGGALLIKYDKNGELIWKKTYGNNKNAIFNDFIYRNDSLYVVGSDHNGIFLRYDLDGNIIESNQYENSSHFYGINMIQNNFYVCGDFSSNHQIEGIVVQYDEKCNPIDNTIVSKEENLTLSKAIVDDAEHLVVIGNLSTTNTLDAKGESRHDGMILKFDSSLKQIDSVSYGDEEDDYFTDILFVEDHYLVVGYSSYQDDSYMSKFIRYSKALKVLGVES